MIKKNNCKLIGLVVILSLSLVSLTGCGAKKATPARAKTNQNGAFAANMKQRISDAIKPLVQDKTIAADQSTKIVEGLTLNTSNFSGQRPNGQNAPGGNTGGNYNGNKGTPGQDGANSGARSGGNTGGEAPRQGNMYTTGLSKLVTDKVITQAQADKVSAALTAMPRQGMQPGAQNQQKTTTS